jgi:KUP system potassium uptake protein
VVHAPEIFYAFNPWYGIAFLRGVGFSEALFILGSLMLVVTGGEALFADMGHFGRAPIRLSWFALVYPALMLNYMGQGAYMLSGQTVQGGNLFFSMVPQPLLFPMIILATMATIIASQALISGVYSLVSQGIGLGLFPRLRIVHTEEKHEGQIYVPFINWALLLGCVMLVVTFKSSTALASAYGLAVAGDMLITSIAMILICKDIWHWSWLRALAIFVPLVIIDASFLAANSLKFFEGGFVPLGIGVIMFVVMKSWQWGRHLVHKSYMALSTLSVGDIVSLNKKNANYFPRSVVALSSSYPRTPEDRVPAVFQAFWDRYKMMPKHLIMLNIKPLKVPYVDNKERYELTVFENDGELGTIAAVRINYGYMETPDFSDALTYINEHPDIVANEDLNEWLILAARERLLKSTKARFLDKARYAIFRGLNRNAIPAYTYYGLGDDLRLATIQVPVKI